MAGLLDIITGGLCRRLDRPWVPFEEAPSTNPFGAGAVGPDPATGPTAVLSTRPGAGGHANDCAYLDDPAHRCVAADGQPSNLVCIATVYQRERLRSEPTPCVVCHQPTARHDQICDRCAQEVA